MKRCLIALATALALTACTGPAANEEEQERDTVVFDSETDWSTASEEMEASNQDIEAFELEGFGKIEGQKVRFSVFASKDGRCAGQMRRPDYTVNFIATGEDSSKLYFKASRPYWQTMAGPTQGDAVADAVAGQWTLYPNTKAADTGVFVVCNFHDWIKYQAPDEDLAYENKGSKSLKKGIRFGKGKNAEVVTTVEDPHRVLAVKEKDLIIEFKSFNEDAFPKDPKYFIDLSS